MVADKAISSFDFMVINFIDVGMLVARWKLGNGKRILDNWIIEERVCLG